MEASRFVDPLKVPESCYCKICHLIIFPKQIVGCPCCPKASYCFECLNAILREYGICPTSGKPVKLTGLHHNEGLAKYLNSMYVHCEHWLPRSDVPFESCEWTGPLEKIDAHLRDFCDFVWVLCPEQCIDPGTRTSTRIRRGRLHHHLKHECQMKSMKEPQSLHSKLYDKSRSATNSTCFGICANCGYFLHGARDPDHDRVCHETRTYCRYRDSGCEYASHRMHLQEHMHRETETHLSLLAKEHIELKDQYEEVLGRIESMRVPPNIVRLRSSLTKVSRTLRDHERALHCPPSRHYWSANKKTLRANSKIVSEPVFIFGVAYTFAIGSMKENKWKSFSVKRLEEAGNEEAEGYVACFLDLDVSIAAPDKRPIESTRKTSGPLCVTHEPIRFEKFIQIGSDTYEEALDEEGNLLLCIEARCPNLPESQPSKPEAACLAAPTVL